MAEINRSRVVFCGLLWALVYSLLGTAAMLLFLGREFLLELERQGRPLQLTVGSITFLGVFSVAFVIGWGIASMWLYAAIRPRYGAGPRTAAIAAMAVWFLGEAVPVGHLAAFGMASARFVAVDLPTELVLILAATLVSARSYKE